MADSSDAGTRAARSSTADELLIEADGVRSVQRLEAESYGLGRASSNQLCYPAMVGLSRQHLVIERSGGRWVVRDLGSTHGSRVNGELISEPRILRADDRISAGGVSLVYHEAESPMAGAVVFSDEPFDASDATTVSDSLQALAARETAEGGSHVRALMAAGRELATHLPIEKLFDLILDLTVEAAGAARGVLMTLTDGELHVRSSKGKGFTISSHVRDLVIREKRSLLVRDAMADSVLALRASIVRHQVRSIMAVPLQTDDRVIGLIYLDSSSNVREFTTGDLSLVTVMANMAAVRIENARLAEVEQAERMRARELEHAALIQRSMLPCQGQRFPEPTDFELHASMVPAREVGGDLFDFFMLDAERLGFVVGDVSGKGVPAALYMATARTVLRATAPHQPSPGMCLTYVNQFLVEQNTPGMFVTLFYGILNARTGVLEYANGGHAPPYVFSPGKVHVLRDRCGPLVGMFAGAQYLTRSTEIEPGGGVLAITDGVTEARDKTGDFFGDERLEAYLTARTSESVEDLVSGLHAEVKSFEAGAPRADDVTVLALRRRQHAQAVGGRE